MVTGEKDIMNSTLTTLIQFQQTDFLTEESLAYLAIIDLYRKKEKSVVQ
jgi:hypothetical protein